MIRTVVADDHQIVRKGICSLLNRNANICVVGEANDGEDAVTIVNDLQPDVALIDISMPRLDGIQATQRIVAANLPTRVVILSVHDRPLIAKRALRAGAKGYLLKDASLEELSLAVTAANRGDIYLSPRLSKAILDSLWSLSDRLEEEEELLLSEREREVLQLLAEGHTNRDIATMLYLSPKTVEKHRANIMTKMDVTDFASLIRRSIQEGLVLF